MTRGVRPGDSPSPLLFSTVMDKIVSYVKLLQEYRMGSEEIHIVCYADDIALIADTVEALQRLLYNFHLSCLKFNMKIPFYKMKAITIAKTLYAANWKLMAGW